MNAETGTRPWHRAVIENVSPQVDGGRFAIKRTVGDTITVEADAFTDGHDQIRVRLAWRHETDPADRGEVEMTPLGNDRWQGCFTVRPTTSTMSARASRSWMKDWGIIARRASSEREK